MIYFKEYIEKLDDILKLNLDLRYKNIALDKFIKDYNIENEIGEVYFNKFINKNKRVKGTVYTPYIISNYIIRNIVKVRNIIDNPFIKICDPACGTGNILVPLFRYLRNVYLENIEIINKNNNIELDTYTLNEHIIKNNIFGYDIDKTALQICKIELFRESGIYSNNIMLKDFLIETCENVDVYIGNPPYIGHKDIEKSYTEYIREKYKEVYKDKGDIHFCFLKKSIDTLNQKGNIGFITSRYFLESKSAIDLRAYITNNINIAEIVDFYGVRPFKNVGIDPCIVFLTTEEIENIKIVKPKNKEYNKRFLQYFINERQGKIFFINKAHFKEETWRLLTKQELGIVKKIEEKSSVKLKDICNSHQGIITGCDKAFILSSQEIEENFIEKDIIKPWIKSTNINKNSVLREDKYIIYSNYIKNEKEYSYAIKYINLYKKRLSKRREVIKGYRRWYELQWGRKANIFEDYKIIFPYKSKNNRFSLDKGSYFSADIYGLTLKQDSLYSYDLILQVLNSPLYEFYFKTFAKKLGENLYEYYPNKLMEIFMPKNTLSFTNNEELFDYFCITEEEKKIIFDWVNN